MENDFLVLNFFNFLLHRYDFLNNFLFFYFFILNISKSFTRSHLMLQKKKLSKFSSQNIIITFIYKNLSKFNSQNIIIIFMYCLDVTHL